MCSLWNVLKNDAKYTSIKNELIRVEWKQVEEKNSKLCSTLCSLSSIFFLVRFSSLSFSLCQKKKMNKMEEHVRRLLFVFPTWVYVYLMQQATSRLTMLHILVGWCTCTREKRPYCDFSANIPFFSISPPSTKLHIIFYTHHNTIPERLKEKKEERAREQQQMEKSFTTSDKIECWRKWEEDHEDEANERQHRLASWMLGVGGTADATHIHSKRTQNAGENPCIEEHFQCILMTYTGNVIRSLHLNISLLVITNSISLFCCTFY